MLNLTGQDKGLLQGMHISVDEEPFPLPELPPMGAPDSVEAHATDGTMVPFSEFHKVSQALDASLAFGRALQRMYTEKSGEASTLINELADARLKVAREKARPVVSAKWFTYFCYAAFAAAGLLAWNAYALYKFSGL